MSDKRMLRRQKSNLISNKNFNHLNVSLFSKLTI